MSNLLRKGHTSIIKTNYGWYMARQMSERKWVAFNIDLKVDGDDMCFMGNSVKCTEFLISIGADIQLPLQLISKPAVRKSIMALMVGKEPYVAVEAQKDEISGITLIRVEK